MGPDRILFFHYFWGHIIFSTPLEPFYFFFLRIKNQNIFLDKNPAPPPPPPNGQSLMPYANNKGADQPDQHLCCSLPRQYDISSIYIGNFMTLASFFSWEDRFSRDEAHMGKILLFNLPS